jgi:hypothetical protein
MKKIYIIIMAASISSALLTSSCKKVLEKIPETTYTVQGTFADSTTAVLYLNTIYTANLPGWAGNGGKLSTLGTVGYGNLTEENRSDNVFVKGAVTIESVGDIGSSSVSNSNYGKIHNINDFIANTATSPIPAATKARFIAQALFWRAYRYFDLVRLYGGVPLVLKPLPVVGAAAKQAAALPRSTTTQTYAQIVADLDTAINSLPAVWPSNADYGRITKGAAQAFLGRVLLTYASPQFNSGNDMSRWQTAYDASTAAITTLSAHGWGLYPKEDVTMWTTEGPGSGGSPANPEAVMVTEYNTFTDANGMDNNSYTSGNVPKSLGGSGGNNPTWDEVQAFPMADGKAPGVSTKYTYDPVHFFDNRDPRFYQTIAYNGCAWPLESNATYRLWTYFYYTNSAGTSAKSTESSASSTGFYCRKAVDPNISASNLVNSGTDWQEIRYAEVLLNQAECAAELGNSATAYADLIAIRNRAGIEAGSDGMYGLTAGLGTSDLINAIMFERQIEFAYEGKRYWDLRRRNLLESTLNGTERQGLAIILKPNGSNKDYLAVTNATTGQAARDTAVANTSLDQVYSTYFSYVPMVLGTSSTPGEIKNVDTYPIAYQTADYFFGIPIETIQNDPNIQQNNTWGGPFNPLQ